MMDRCKTMANKYASSQSHGEKKKKIFFNLKMEISYFYFTVKF